MSHTNIVQDSEGCHCGLCNTSWIQCWDGNYRPVCKCPQYEEEGHNITFSASIDSDLKTHGLIYPRSPTTGNGDEP